MIKPEYKGLSEIEYESQQILRSFSPAYKEDLSKNIDSYELAFDFIPDYMKSRYGNFNFETKLVKIDNQDFQILGVTSSGGIFLNQQLFDNSDSTAQRMFNWTCWHESYHAIHHYPYLKIGSSLESATRENGYNPFCWQANTFAGFCQIPKQRLKNALLEEYNCSNFYMKRNKLYDARGKSLGDNNYFIGKDELFFHKILARGIQKHFDCNLTPISIAIERDQVIEEKSSTIICI